MEEFSKTFILECRNKKGSKVEKEKELQGFMIYFKRMKVRRRNAELSN
jgi:hypothetical protein